MRLHPQRFRFFGRLDKAAVAMATIAVLPALVQAQSPECQGLAIQKKAVALAAPRIGPVVDFVGSGGNLDPAPLLQTNVLVTGIPGRPVCVTVTFSAQADPFDNYGVYQASIDDIPMAGHGSLQPEYGFATPIVFDATNQSNLVPVYTSNLNPRSRMVSYTFFASVVPGLHTVRIRVASCCSPVSPGGLHVRAATLVVTH